MYTRELLKLGNRSLVECYEKSEDGFRDVTKKYVVCTDYNGSKKYGDQWINGHYFDVWTDDEMLREVMLRKATMNLMGIVDHDVEYERLKEIAEYFRDGLLANDEESALEYFESELDDDEMEFLGIENKKYDVVEVVVTRTFSTTKTIVVPKGTERWEYDNYFYADDIDDEDFDCFESTEIDASNVIESGIKRSRVEDRYNLDNDFDDFE